MNTSTHAYHQHVYPFQIISGFDESEYFKYGDYHDTWFDETIADDRYGIIRFAPRDFTGGMVLHCHVLMHEDFGMMTMEKILPKGSGSQCAEGFEGTEDDYVWVDDYDDDGKIGAPFEEPKRVSSVDGVLSYNLDLSYFKY